MSLATYHFWYNFIEVRNVLAAFLRGYRSPELQNAVLQFDLCPWLDDTANVFFELMPDVLDWIKIRGL